MGIQAGGILVVDDERPILNMMEMVLDRFGYTVDTAENGEKAMEKINRISYDLIITDMKMPRKSGQEVLEYVKIQKNLKTPVVGMSGTPWLLEHVGFDAVLAKPFLLPELKHLIEGIIKL
ncbi:response regulator [Desulfospira joergensenii]|uniref:response regulator n=1 Tax=Desulfospira joergensenii TaxID=53329 RepID=UPI0003B347FB|nr:response regulator [Desulfospira joergensenii]